MRIGEVARLAGASPRSVRHYEAAGLVHGERGDNGYRDFDEGAVVRVRNIKILVDLGLTLDDVRAFEMCLDGDVTAATPTPAKVAVAKARLAELQRRRDDLDAACGVLERALGVHDS